MATLFFSANASTGAGSLAETIRNASPGDVVRPDETLFERGQTIVVRLAESLRIDKNLTLDGGPFRVQLDGGASFRCAQVATGVNANFTSFEFVGGVARNGGGLYVENGARVELNRCSIYGCDATRNGGGVCVNNNATLVLADSAVFANRAQNAGGGAYLAATARFTSIGSTLAANVDATLNGGDFSDVVAAPGYDATSSVPRNSIICVATSGNATLYNASQAAVNGSVVDVSVGDVGFVAPGVLASPYADWTPNVWQNANLRLFDDASPAPSSRRDSGNVEFQTTYDLDGNFRGRTLDGLPSCSPGAYETIQADLFWVGVDAGGAQVQSPSLLAPEGWASSRFATVGSGVAPESGQTLFLDGAVAFAGGSLKPTRFIVGGYANISFATTASKTLTSVFEIGIGATTRQTDKTQMFSASESAASRFGDW
ncbi:MAG: hypothetical protein IJO46_08155, partial [Thermoguttaceae bacterium]|nr:hypothetical protein [Thermoguttaceae bacterium]